MSDSITEDVMINLFSRLFEDLTINILSRLSMKTLLRCGSVCKSWKALIASSYFINAHLNFNRDNTPQILIRSYKERLLTSPKTKDDSQEFLLSKLRLESFYVEDDIDDDIDERFSSDSESEDDPKVEESSDSESEEDVPKIEETYLSYYYGNNETFDLHNKFDVPWVAFKGVFEIMGSCNGLICLGIDYVPLVIWNPLINKAVILPDPTYIMKSKCRIGFGYDIARNDYKIVRITRMFDVELYRLSTRSWEDISHLEPPYNPFVDAAYLYSAYLNGVAHWIAFKYEDDGAYGVSVIGFFDMHTEVFGEMRLSRSLINSGSVGYPTSTLLASQGSLWLINSDDEEGILKFDIWLMKEYGVAESWIMQFSVNIGHYFSRPLCFLNNGEMLWEREGRTLTWYNPQSKEFRIIENRTPTTATLIPYYVTHYVPSLVLHDQNVDFWDRNKCILGSNVESIKENLQI